MPSETIYSQQHSSPLLQQPGIGAPIPTESIAFRYLNRFQCHADTCNAYCCRSWEIKLDQGQYKRIKQALTAGSGDRNKALWKWVRTDHMEKRAGHNHAYIALRPDGNCPFLEQDRLCYIHRHYGEDHLGNECASYPRFMSQVGERIEVVGTLSCPEIARLCLLDEDSMELVDYNPEKLPPILSNRLVKKESDPYSYRFDDIRAFMLKFLYIQAVPVATRLFFMSYFANRVRSYFNKSISNFDEIRLYKDMAQMEDANILESLAKQFMSIEISSSFTMDLVQRFLNVLLKSDCTAQFRGLVRTAYLNIEQQCSGSDTPYPKDRNNFHIPVDRIWHYYQKQKEHHETAFGSRIDQYFVNYSANYWITNWYIQSPDLLAHMQKLLLRMAVIRFLLYDYADVEFSDGMNSSQKIFDDAAVKVFSEFSRSIEHDPAFLSEIEKWIKKEGLLSLAHLVYLLKF